MAITRFDRWELKFVVDAEQRRRLTDAVTQRLPFDANGDDQGRYPIVSLYYDNDALDLLLAGMRGIGSRRKLRLRVYGDEATQAGVSSFIEVKQRYLSRSSKRRIALSFDEGLALASGADLDRPVEAYDSLVIAEIHEMVRSLRLHPISLLRYERQALHGLGDEADLRLTFDSPVQARARDLLTPSSDPGFDLELLEPGYSVMEIKVDQAVPYWLSRLVAELGCTRRSFSKYQRAVLGLGIEPRAPSRSSSSQRRPVSLAIPASLEPTWTP
jgi:SPX domain protein involved in polyphosphate accumulation